LIAAQNEGASILNVRSLLERLAWLFFFWNVLYFPFKVMEESYDAYKVFDKLISPTLLFTGLAPHLWAFSSLLFGVLFIAIVYRFGVKFLLPVVALASLAISLVGGGYQIFKLGFILGFNVPRFWLSIPFVYLGMLTYQKGKPAWYVAVALAALGAALQVYEARFLAERYELPIANRQFLFGTILMAYGMASLALHDWKLPHTPPLAAWGREYALAIYLLYPIAYQIIVQTTVATLPYLALFAFTQILFPVLTFFAVLWLASVIQKRAPAFYNRLLGIPAEAA
jgi:hypothetical protein